MRVYAEPYMNQFALATSARSDLPTKQQQAHRIARVHQLEYLNDMLPEMRKMALGLDQRTLAYLLEMTMMEAQLQLDLHSFELEPSD